MSEIEEVKHLLSVATFPGVRNVLENYMKTILPGEEVAEQIAPMETNSEAEYREAAPKPSPPAVKKAVLDNYVPPLPAGATFVPITDFAWDQGGYNSATVTVYVELPGVGAAKERVHCNFTNTSFDLTVMDLGGKCYRLLKDNLEKDIDPAQSKIVIKKDKVVIKLQKIKGEYSFEHWARLTAKKAREPGRPDSKKDPSSAIMEMMRDMYDEGDDNMKKVIGEAMMKSRSGEKPDTGDMGM